MSRLITVWRKPDNILEWDFHISEDKEEALRVVNNLVGRRVHQFTTYPLGEKLPELSSEF